MPTIRGIIPAFSIGTVLAVSMLAASASASISLPLACSDYTDYGSCNPTGCSNNTFGNCQCLWDNPDNSNGFPADTNSPCPAGKICCHNLPCSQWFDLENCLEGSRRRSDGVLSGDPNCAWDSDLRACKCKAPLQDVAYDTVVGIFAPFDCFCPFGAPDLTATECAELANRPRPLTGKMLTLGANPLAPEKGILAATLEGGSVDLGLGAGSPDDPRVVGGAVHLQSEVGNLDLVYPLPAANWKATLKKGTLVGWTYKDAKRLAGPIGRVSIRPGKPVVVKGKGAGLGFQLPTDPRPVRLSLAIGESAIRYCGAFGGTVSFKPGTQYKATKAPAPASCD
jgi:hypothetical protein